MDKSIQFLSKLVATGFICVSFLTACGGSGGGNSDDDNGTSNATSSKTTYFIGNNGLNGDELWKTDGTSVNTVQVKDINLTGDSEPSKIYEVGGIIFFVADDGIHGKELWKRDNNGASLVKDIYLTSVASENGKHSSHPRNFIQFSNQLFFTAYDGNNQGLWVSDGSSAGTVKLADTDFKYPLVFNGELYFNGTGGLWKTDGTLNGTQLFYANINSRLIATDNAMFFNHSDANGLELWTTDGTVNGTSMIVDINSSGDGIPSTSNRYYKLNNTIYFAATDADGTELWKTDGTAQSTVQVADINPGTDSGISETPFISTINNQLFFVANDGVHGEEVWVSDGTSAGTNMVIDLNNAATGSLSYSNKILAVLNNEVIFTADTNDYTVRPIVGGFGREVYISDGTAQGTRLLKDVNPGVDSSGVNIQNIIVNNELYFTANNGTQGYELWKTDGTSNGTVIVKDIKPGTDSSSPNSVVATSIGLVFSADNGVSGRELWVTNGDAASTSLLADINTTSNASSFPSKVIDINGVNVFLAQTNSFETNLYRTDGTDSSTELLTSIQGRHYISGIDSIIKAGNFAYFLNSDTTNGTELWQTDGTSAGTKIVKDITPGLPGSNFYFMGNAGEFLYFSIYDSNTLTLSLWKTNGTDSGTVVVHAFSEYVEMSHITHINGKLIFPINSTQYGTELWVSDGTSSGTKVLKDINSGTAGGISYYCESRWFDCEMVTINGELFFIANDGSSSRQLWKTNGTTSGTLLVKNIDLTVKPSSSNFFDSSIAAFSGKLVFTGYDSTNGRELWVSDGTSDGTGLLKNIQPESNSLNATVLPIGEKALVFAETVYGNESCSDPLNCDKEDDIWITDGTPEGTTPVYAGTDGNSGSLTFKVVDNKVYFVKADNQHGAELWISDATAQGTYMIKDINPGPGDGAYFND